MQSEAPSAATFPLPADEDETSAVGIKLPGRLPDARFKWQL